jgi:hypothetical protein
MEEVNRKQKIAADKVLTPPLSLSLSLSLTTHAGKAEH